MLSYRAASSFFIYIALEGKREPTDRTTNQGCVEPIAAAWQVWQRRNYCSVGCSSLICTSFRIQQFCSVFSAPLSDSHHTIMRFPSHHSAFSRASPSLQLARYLSSVFFPFHQAFPPLFFTLPPAASATPAL